MIRFMMLEKIWNIQVPYRLHAHGIRLQIFADTEQCAASPESLLLGKNVMRHPEEALACCPVSFVTKDAPPFLIIHGDNDHTVPFGQGEELHDELEKAGCDVTLLSIENADHADIHFFQKQIWDEICTFFKTKL